MGGVCHVRRGGLSPRAGPVDTGEHERAGGYSGDAKSDAPLIGLMQAEGQPGGQRWRGRRGYVGWALMRGAGLVRAASRWAGAEVQGLSAPLGRFRPGTRPGEEPSTRTAAR